MAMNVREEAQKRLLVDREKDDDVRRLQETLQREAAAAKAEREVKVRSCYARAVQDSCYARVVQDNSRCLYCCVRQILLPSCVFVIC